MQKIKLVDKSANLIELSQKNLSEVDTLIINSTLECVKKHGLENVSIDEIVNLSGVPRSTIYRRIGGHDELLKLMIFQQAREFDKITIKISQKPTSLYDRIYEILVVSIQSLSKHEWMHSSVVHGLSRRIMNIFYAVSEMSQESALVNLLLDGQKLGLVKPEINISDFRIWLTRQIIDLGSYFANNEAAIKNHVKYYMMPILFEPNMHPEKNIEDRLDMIEAKLNKLLDKFT